MLDGLRLLSGLPWPARPSGQSLLCSPGVVLAPGVGGGGGQPLPLEGIPEKRGGLCIPPHFTLLRKSFLPGSGGCVGRCQGFDCRRARSDPEWLQPVKSEPDLPSVPVCSWLPARELNGSSF